MQRTGLNSFGAGTATRSDSLSSDGSLGSEEYGYNGDLLLDLQWNKKAEKKRKRASAPANGYVYKANGFFGLGWMWKPSASDVEPELEGREGEENGHEIERLEMGLGQEQWEREQDLERREGLSDEVRVLSFVHSSLDG